MLIQLKQMRKMCKPEERINKIIMNKNGNGQWAYTIQNSTYVCLISIRYARPSYRCHA